MPQAVPRRVETYLAEDGHAPFQTWLDGLKDQKARIIIDKMIAKVRLGNLADHKAVGEGVQEIRLTYGPGIRIYFGESGDTLVILLSGGTKKRQSKDIAQAKLYWQDWKERTSK